MLRPTREGRLEVQVILYDPQDPVFPPPHKFVIELLGKRDYQNPKSFAELQASESRHQACLLGELREEKLYNRSCTADDRCPVHRIYPCAACDWTKPQVAALRVKKKRALRAFELTGKLPPLPKPNWQWPKKYILDAHNLPKLPPMPDNPWPPTLTVWDKTLDNVIPRYLEAMGEKPGANGWTCGCVIAPETSYQRATIKTVCEKHRRAILEGRED